MTLLTTGSASSDQATSSDDPAVIEQLSERSCRDRLPGSGVGRYRVEGTETPFLPVEYRVDDGDLLVCVPGSHRTASSTRPSNLVSLVMHGEGGAFGGPWIIAASGRLTPVTDRQRLRRLQDQESAWGGGAACGQWYELRGLRLEGHHIVGAAQR
jgi:hypothetical protein